MTLEVTLDRVAEISNMLGANRVNATVGAGIPTSITQTTDLAAADIPGAQAASRSFATAMSNARSESSGPGSAGEKILALARQELAKGVAEQPPGSNESPDIARYRTATNGAIPGAAWCAYFVSYLARESGVPIGKNGEGMGYVPALANWAKSEGLWVEPSEQPRPGDLIVFGGDGHIGVVDEVLPDGNIKTIEGNHSNRVDAVTRNRNEPIGFVRLG